MCLIVDYACSRHTHPSVFVLREGAKQTAQDEQRTGSHDPACQVPHKYETGWQANFERSAGLEWITVTLLAAERPEAMSSKRSPDSGNTFCACVAAFELAVRDSHLKLGL